MCITHQHMGCGGKDSIPERSMKNNRTYWPAHLEQPLINGFAQFG